MSESAEPDRPDQKPRRFEPRPQEVLRSHGLPPHQDAPRVRYAKPRGGATPAMPAGGKKAFGGKPSFGEKPSYRDKPPFSAKPPYGAKPPSTPHPQSGGKPQFGDRPAAGGKPLFSAKPHAGGKPPFGAKPSFGAKPPYSGKPAFGVKPSFGGKPQFGARPAFGAKPQSRGPMRPSPGAGRPMQPKAPPPAFIPATPPTDWTDAADWYDRLVGEAGSEYHQKVVLPGVARLLAAAPGEPVIDVACGQGVLCRILAERGIEVTGVDAAAPLIDAARLRGPEHIRYQVGDARELLALPASHFAAAACVLAIQNINPIPPVFAAIHRLLRPGGRLVLAMMHPCFRGPRQTAWGWDPADSIQYRRVDRYLQPRKIPIVTHPGSAPDQYTWSFHRPIEAYVKALRAAGLLIDAIEEWPSHRTSEPGPRAAAENQARKEIPLFMAIRAIKIDMPLKPQS